jgi:DNA repair protein RecN (Recombination protein N)
MLKDPAMLVSIRIKNLALVDDLTLELGKGFNAITGETGAGKSILIGAFSLVLGERADREWIRSGTDSCTVEAVMEVRGLKDLSKKLEEFGIEPCQENQLLLKRVFSSSGTNRQFVNGTPTTLQILKQLGELLVDIHGPHDHQSLLKTEVQLRILDGYAGVEKQRNKFAEILSKLREIEERKKSLIMDEQQFRQQLDLLNHQVNEIDAAQLKSGEEVQIETEYTVASNAQKILDHAARAQDVLAEGEVNASSAISQAYRAIKELANVDPKAKELEKQCETLSGQISDLVQDLSRYAAKVDADPERLNFLSERVTLIQNLKRKYGKTIEEINEFGENAKSRLKDLQCREESLAKLDAESGKVSKQLNEAGEALRAARQKSIPKLSKSVIEHLKDLGFGHSSFAIEMRPCEPTALGMDEIEFRFAPNAGEPQKSLRDIASSGEMARVMLALKTALAEQDEIPVLVFDEVDANVGGEIGTRVGEKMGEIGKGHQVLCITHLPQVAAYGKSHFLVSKTVQNGRTITNIENLDKNGRADEIGRMLGGKSETALKHAKEMLKKAGN